MTAPKYIDDLMQLPRDSLLVGTLSATNREGVEVTNSMIEGTPSAFRALAGMLVKMADSVESAEEGKGWGLALHPDDIPALRTLGVAALSLGCQQELSLAELDRAEPG